MNIDISFFLWDERDIKPTPVYSSCMQHKYTSSDAWHLNRKKTFAFHRVYMLWALQMVEKSKRKNSSVQETTKVGWNTDSPAVQGNTMLLVLINQYRE